MRRKVAKFPLWTTCANVFYNLGDMGKLCERQKSPKLSQEEIDNLNNPIFIKVIQFVG